MKTGDKVFYIEKDCKGRDSFKVFIIGQISKDGTKFRPILMPDCSGGHPEVVSFDDKKLITNYEALKGKVMDIFSERNGYNDGFLVMDGTLPTCWSSIDIIKIEEIKEDDFDDALNIRCEQYGNDYMSRLDSHIKYPALRIDNGDYVQGHYRVPLVYIDTADNLLSYLADFADFSCRKSLLEKNNEWQKKFGYEESEDLWPDFTGDHKQLEYAIENGIDPADYDRWQKAQEIFKRELRYETANAIFNTLYEKEDIEILDCE